MVQPFRHPPLELIASIPVSITIIIVIKISEIPFIRRFVETFSNRFSLSFQVVATPGCLSAFDRRAFLPRFIW